MGGNGSRGAKLDWVELAPDGGHGAFGVGRDAGGRCGRPQLEQ